MLKKGKAEVAPKKTKQPTPSESEEEEETTKK